jgi:hypothetical protein
MRLILGLSLLIFGTTAAVAVRPDECEQRRAQGDAYDCKAAK